jgi:predicted metalloprotease with PDZ domain
VTTLRSWLTIGAVNLAAGLAFSPQPTIAYSLRVDPGHLDIVEVAIRLDHVPSTVRLAMKVHPEYDAKYWRYLDSARVDRSANDLEAGIAREDSTLWRVTLPGGYGTVHYRIHVQPDTEPVRRAWRPFMQSTGGLINSPDFFLYLPDFVNAPVTLQLDVPPGWRIATALEARGTPARFAAPNAAAFLDAPLLLGNLHEWQFRDRGTAFHVLYWPLPNAAPFDTLAFVDELRRLVASTMDVFGSAPSPSFFFLIQDGAGDALEHRTSVTLGVQSSALARDPRASLQEMAHEFFHTWNLVTIHPDNYLELRYQAPRRTTGLWWGEGVTLYYADALPRRAGLRDTTASRLDHLADLLRYYYGSWIARVPPERASLAFEDSPISNPDASGGYYAQGELLGGEIDALLRDSTHEARGIDDIMRALYRQSTNGRGYTSATLEAVADSVCGCRLHQLFATQVRGNTLIDAAPIVARLGLTLVVDTVAAVDSAGAPLPDRRLGLYIAEDQAPLFLVVNNPGTAWRGAGLRTGDQLVALNDRAIGGYDDLHGALQALRIGDTALVDIRRGGVLMRIRAPATGYARPRVRFVDTPNVTPEQRARRMRWLAGW